MKRLATIGTLATALLLLACSSDNDSPTGPTGPSTIQVFSGDWQAGTVLSFLPEPLVVEVLDAGGEFEPGRTVTFTSDYGSVDPVEAVTNSVGQAHTRYTVGPAAGEQSVVASVGGESTTFTILAGADLPSRLVLVSGDGQTASAGSITDESIVVKVTDAAENPIPGIQVQFVPDAGSAEPTQGTSGPDGTAASWWTLGRVAGKQSMDISTVAGSSIVVSATAVPGPVSALAVAGGEGQVGQRGSLLSAAILVQAADAYGNAVPDVIVSFTASGNGFVSAGEVTTNQEGLAETAWTLSSDLGTQTMTAASMGLAEVVVSAEATAAMMLLDHVAIDAVIHPVDGRILTISADPPSLNLIDPVTGTTTSIPLGPVPTALSVQPDGSHAAVGHDGFISYVNLASMVVERVYTVSADVVDLELPGNGWVYAFPRVDQWETIRSVELSSGSENNTGGIIRAGTLVKLHPSGDYIYGADNGVSPSDFEKYDIRAGPAQVMYDSPYHGDYPFGGNLWIYEDGSRIVARSGRVFTSSSVQSQDLLYVGSLPDVYWLNAAAHSEAMERVLVIGRDEAIGSAGVTRLRSFTDSFYGYQGSITLPSYMEDNASGIEYYPSEGRFVLVDPAGAHVYVLVRGYEPYEGRFPTGLVVFEASDIP
jgi:hypothetical protein